MPTDIILAHSGSLFPDYINDTIQLINSYNYRIHIILEKKFHSNIKLKSNTKIINIDDIIDDRYLEYSLINYNSKFRDGFFTRASSRFILIDNYLQQTNITSCLHIENDVALFSDLSHIVNILNLSNYDTSIVMDHPFRCVPSIIWYKNKQSSSRMANFICRNNHLDDMKNLAIYFHRYKNDVTNFPIVPFDLIDEENGINFGNMYHDFDSVFDGAAIGQYLFGIDDITNTNKDTKGFINETTVYDISKLSPYVQNKQPYIKHRENRSIKVNNLHMHCKNLKQLL